MEEIKDILLNVQNTVIKLQIGQEEMRQDIKELQIGQEKMKKDIKELQNSQEKMLQTVNRIDETQNIAVKEIISMQRRISNLESHNLAV